MIYFLHGTDTKNSRRKMHEILGQLSGKRPNSEVFKITSENWQSEQFDELLGAQGLFEKKYIVVLDFLFSQKDIKENILKKLKEMQEAEHWFLILDGKTDVATTKKIEKFSYKSQEFEKTESKKESPIIFTITDKLLARNKKQLWVCFTDLLGRGIPAEEIHGVLFWAVKNMIIVARVDSQKESGLPPFSYSKALSGGRNYKLAELKKMSGDLVEMTHKVRTGKGEMEVMLEKWMLEI
jgi:DNA polymerase III delta subunit